AWTARTPAFSSMSWKTPPSEEAPKLNWETSSPVFPRGRYCMGPFLLKSCRLHGRSPVRVRPGDDAGEGAVAIRARLAAGEHVCVVGIRLGDLRLDGFPPRDQPGVQFPDAFRHLGGEVARLADVFAEVEQLETPVLEVLDELPVAGADGAGGRVALVGVM